MAKDRLNDPGYKTPYTDEERSPGGHGRGNGRKWFDHGGRSVSGGPAPGEKSGVARGDTYRGRSTGTKRDNG
jgi:hypothetical protein